MLVNISELQTYLPARLKFALKPYYRKVFPNRLIVNVLPTYRCNYRCSYCMVVTKFDYTTLFPKASEKSAAEWCAALDKLPPALIYFHGGEPILYAELPELVNNLPAKHQVVGIVTNLSLPAAAYRKIKKKIHLNASLHREYVEPRDFVEKVKDLSSQFHIHVNLVATPENLEVMDALSREMHARKVTLHIDPFVNPEFQYDAEQLRFLKKFLKGDRNPEQQLDFQDYSPKRCSAGRNYMHLVPNGDAFTCGGGITYLSPRYAHIVEGHEQPQFAMGNLFDPDFRLNREDMICALPCKQGCDRDFATIRPA